MCAVPGPLGSRALLLLACRVSASGQIPPCTCPRLPLFLGPLACLAFCVHITRVGFVVSLLFACGPVRPISPRFGAGAVAILGWVLLGRRGWACTVSSGAVSRPLRMRYWWRPPPQQTLPRVRRWSLTGQGPVCSLQKGRALRGGRRSPPHLLCG